MIYGDNLIVNTLEYGTEYDYINIWWQLYQRHLMVWRFIFILLLLPKHCEHGTVHVILQISISSWLTQVGVNVVIILRPDFFYFMVYRHFCSLSNVGIRNKNKNKISVMSDLYWLSSKRKPTLTHTKKQTIQNDRKLNPRHFDTK